MFGPEFGHGRTFDLKRLRAALTALGDPRAKLPPIVHVAGTNGKGSTIAFMRAIANAAGLRTHAFTKPHLLHLKERFWVGGAFTKDGALIATAERIARTDSKLTQFDAQVATALLLFSEEPADLALIETGMGGFEDSTNVIETPALAVLTPIDLDHADALGGSLPAIARHKAGIIKRGAPVVSARQQPEALRVIEAEALRLETRLYLQGRDWDCYPDHGGFAVQTEDRLLDLPLPNLRGAHQIANAGLAVAASLLLRDPRITDDALGNGVKGADWPGRLQLLKAGSLAAQTRAAGAELWLDGGHNAHAARALAAALGAMTRERPTRTSLIVGLRARKDAEAFIAALASAAAHIIIVPLGAEDTPPAQIAAMARAAGVESETAPNLSDALSSALAGRAGRILICGSFLLVSEALRA